MVWALENNILSYLPGRHRHFWEDFSLSLGIIPMALPGGLLPGDWCGGWWLLPVSTLPFLFHSS